MSSAAIVYAGRCDRPCQSVAFFLGFPSASTTEKGGSAATRCDNGSHYSVVRLMTTLSCNRLIAAQVPRSSEVPAGSSCAGVHRLAHVGDSGEPVRTNSITLASNITFPLRPTALARNDCDTTVVAAVTCWYQPALPTRVWYGR